MTQQADLQEQQQTENLYYFCTVYNKQSTKDLNLEEHFSGISSSNHRMV